MFVEDCRPALTFMIAALFLTTEAVIADKPDDNGAAGGGMPDMDF